MSYVHCHTCNWEQDDFWGRRYNPIRFFLKSELPNYIMPRMIDFDPKPYSYGRVFSWYVLWRLVVKWCRRVATQKWWTYNSWQKARKAGKGGCPKCGSGLCID